MRLHWIPEAGREVFFVINQNLEDFDLDGRLRHRPWRHHGQDELHLPGSDRGLTFGIDAALAGAGHLAPQWPRPPPRARAAGSGHGPEYTRPPRVGRGGRGSRREDRYGSCAHATPPVIDGELDEAVLGDRPPCSTTSIRSIRSSTPPSAERMEIRLLYDDDALYVGAKMFDAAGRASRRNMLRQNGNDHAGRHTVRDDRPVQRSRRAATSSA